MNFLLQYISLKLSIPIFFSNYFKAWLIIRMIKKKFMSYNHLAFQIYNRHKSRSMFHIQIILPLETLKIDKTVHHTILVA